MNEMLHGWLRDAELRILAELDSNQLAELSKSPKWHLLGKVVSLSDWHDHSLVRFDWQLVTHQDAARSPAQGIGFAGVYLDKIFLLDSDIAFAHYLKSSGLEITSATKTHLTVALECAVLGWTDKKRLINTVADMQELHLDLEVYGQILDKITPPTIEETSVERRLAIWMYHWAISGMMVCWVAVQPKDGKLPYMERRMQLLPNPDW